MVSQEALMKFIIYSSFFFKQIRLDDDDPFKAATFCPSASTLFIGLLQDAESLK